MTAEELAEVLRSCSPMQLEVVIRRPEDDEEMLQQIQQLQDDLLDLRRRNEEMAGCVTENLALRIRLKSARKILKANGLPFDFCDR